MTPKKTNPLEPVRVELTSSTSYTRQPCDLCGGHTEKAGVLAEVREGELAGFRTCEACLRRVSEGADLDAMLRERADALLAEASVDAARLRSAVGRLRVPAYRQWVRAAMERDYLDLLARYADDAAIGAVTMPEERASIGDALLGELTGDPCGAWDGGPAFQTFAIARAMEDGLLTAGEVAEACVRAAYPLRDGMRVVRSSDQGDDLAGRVLRDVPLARRPSESGAHKAAILAKYAEREPKRFVQLDAHFSPDGPDDSLMAPDEEGDALTASETFELMHGASVRVLIDADCDPALALHRLRKLADWLACDPALMRKFFEPVGF
jgi:hypothetical protein